MFHKHEASCGGHFYGDYALIPAFPIGWSQAERRPEVAAQFNQLMNDSGVW